MLIILIRTFILYMLVLFVLRVMGKGELSKMDPFQMVILFMIAELASLPIESPDVSIITGVTALVTLLFLQVLISFISLKSERFKRIISGKPSILIDKGNIDVKELNHLRISINDLTEQLRLKNYPSIADLDYAILEVNGDLSVIPSPQKRALTPADLSINPGEESLPMVLISDGNLYGENLRKIGLTENQLKGQLLSMELVDYKQILLCYSDEKKKLHVYPRKEGLGRRIPDLSSPGSAVPVQPSSIDSNISIENKAPNDKKGGKA